MSETTKKPKNTPYFSQGVLKFEKSGHILTTNGKYYVCSKKQKGQCKLPEKSIKIESLERNFSRLARDFEVPEGEKWAVMKKIMGETLHNQIDDFLENKKDLNDEIIESSINLMKDDIQENKRKQFKKDTKDALEAMERSVSNKTETIMGIILGTVFAFSKEEASENDMGRILAYLSETIYLSEEGKIIKIKPHMIGDYIFQYIKRYCVNYLTLSKWLTEMNKLEDFNYRKFINQVRTRKLEETIIPPLALGHSAVTLSSRALSIMFNMTPEKITELLIFAHNSPIGQAKLQMDKMTKKRKYSL